MSQNPRGSFSKEGHDIWGQETCYLSGVQVTGQSMTSDDPVMRTASPLGELDQGKVASGHKTIAKLILHDTNVCVLLIG